MEMLAIEHPRFVSIILNSDEQLGVYVKGMALLKSGEVRVAGFIEREDSKMMLRAHKPRIKDLFNGTWYVMSYEEYDDKDGGQIHVELKIAK